jgi:RNA polymerase sigma-70 factor, ECF subfamily
MVVSQAVKMKEFPLLSINSLNDQNDQRVILNVRKGNQDAFGIIVDRYRERSLRIATSMVGDMDTARDLSQEAFIKAYRSLGVFDLNAPFLPWFYKILRNVCRDYLRKRTRFYNMVNRFKQRSRNDPDLMDEIQRDDVVQKVRTAVAALDVKNREIIELKHFAGLTYREISDILGIPKGTVMSRLFYARKALREKLENTLDFLSEDTQ